MHLSLTAVSYLWSVVGVWLALFSLQNVLVSTGIDGSVIDVPGIGVLHSERASGALLGSIALLVGLRILAWVWSEFYKSVGESTEGTKIISPPMPFEEDKEHPNLVVGKVTRRVFICFPVFCLVWLLGTIYIGEIYDHDNLKKQPYHTNPIVSRGVVTVDYFTASKCTMFPSFNKSKPACQYRLGSPTGVSYIPLITDLVPLFLALHVFISFKRIFSRRCRTRGL
ncbi:hypothetical protein ACP3VU_17425 [Vibrio sp. PNB23_22_6]